jgi:hypothetical protein
MWIKVCLSEVNIFIVVNTDHNEGLGSAVPNMGSINARSGSENYSWVTS